jgi:hypothetical protein
MKTAVLFKTHLWTQELEDYARKLLADCQKVDVEFWILMHVENEIPMIHPSLQSHLIVFNENTIKELYQQGYHGIWLSNHWIMMWFYQSHSNYDYYWSVEYDVRITGATEYLWNLNIDHDFLYPVGGYRNCKHSYNSLYTKSENREPLKNLDRVFGMLQIARYSQRALQYLDECFREGENGQDEMIIFSLIHRSGFKASRSQLGSMILGNWTWDSRYSNHNRQIYQSLLRSSSPRVCILHPIKPIDH